MHIVLEQVEDFYKVHIDQEFTKEKEEAIEIVHTASVVCGIGKNVFAVFEEMQKSASEVIFDEGHLDDMYDMSIRELAKFLDSQARLPDTIDPLILT